MKTPIYYSYLPGNLRKVQVTFADNATGRVVTRLVSHKDFFDLQQQVNACADQFQLIQQ